MIGRVLAMAVHCEQVRELLVEYDEGGLTPAERSRVERHLGGCPECRGVHARLRASWEGLGAWPDLEPRQGYGIAFWRRLGEEEARRELRWRKLFLALPFRLAPLFAALLVAGTFFLGAHYGARRSSPPPSPVAARTTSGTPAFDFSHLELGVAGPLEELPKLHHGLGTREEIALAVGEIDPPLTEDALQGALSSLWSD